MLKLDGSYLEGGGSIARIALALSTITQKPFEIENIRKNRPQAGLKSQHLFCIKALEQLCSAKAEGAFLGSQGLKYTPGKIQAKDIEIDIQTSGSISLFLQSVLMPLMFANKASKIKIIGGTSGKWAAPIEYFKEVFLPQIQKYVKIDLKLIKRGYYPKGNGIVELKINPIYKMQDFKDFDEFHNKLKNNQNEINLMEQGHLIQIKGVSHASKDLQNAQVAERQAKAAETILKNKFNCRVSIQEEYSEALSTGSGITLWAIFSLDKDEIDDKNPIRLGADSLGERGKKAEDVGKEAAFSLINEIESKAPADRHLTDQILPFIALFGGRIKASKITNKLGLVFVLSPAYLLEKVYYTVDCFIVRITSR